MWWFAGIAWGQDGDGDGVPDVGDDCPSVADPAQGTSFGAPRSLPPSSADGKSVAAADVNGDGLTDIVLLTTYHLEVWIQRADGTWRLGQSEPMYDDAWVLVVGDVDGDGDPDAVVDDNGRIRPFLDEGGTLTPTPFVWVGPDGSDLALVDLQGDGWLDVAILDVTTTIDPYTSAVSWDRYTRWLDLTTGALTTIGWHSSRNANGGELAVADVDGDGDRDLVEWLESDQAIYGIASTPSGPDARTLLRSSVTSVGDLEGGDLDGDGDDEIVYADAAAVQVLTRTGAAWSTAPIATVSHPYDLELTDVDEDGALDAVVAQRGADAFAVSTGDHLRNTPLGSRALALASGDLDGDGVRDVVIVDGSTYAAAWIPSQSPSDNDADGICDLDDACPLDPAPCVDTDGDGLSDASELVLLTDPSLPDTDGDGLDDLAEVLGGSDPRLVDTDGDGIADLDDTCGATDGDLDGVCDVSDLCPTSFDPLQDDRDGDGQGDACDACADVPALAPDALLVAGGDLGGTAVALFDADLDGDLDVLKGGNDPWGVYATLLYPNLGDGTLGAGEYVTPRTGVQAEAARIDADEDPDLVLADEGQLSWSSNLGHAWSVEHVVADAAHRVGWVTPVDLDLDGVVDLVTIEEDGQWIGFYVGSGDGTFVARPRVRVPSHDVVNVLLAGDVDGDGLPDLVATGPATFAYTFLSDGAWTARQNPFTSNVRDLGDVDLDGDLDVVTVQSDVEWWANDGAGVFGDHHRVFDGDAAQDARIVDLDHDGDMDIAWNDLAPATYRRHIGWSEHVGTTFTARWVDDVVVAWPLPLLVGDLDGDGDDELAQQLWWRNLTAPDLDGDGVCDPSDPDTDGDGLPDVAERAAGLAVDRTDTDGDGLSDGEEAGLGADPGLGDTDGDGLDDATEVALGTDPGAVDSDGDGLDDPDELSVGSDPSRRDTDRDGAVDGADGCPAGADADHDQVCDLADACPTVVDDQTDTDGDGVGDACDGCPEADPGQGGAFAAARELGVVPTDLGSADVDGDGIAELVVAADDELQLWATTGSRSVLGPTRPGPARLLVTDLDHDARLDVIASSAAVGEIRWWPAGDPGAAAQTLGGAVLAGELASADFTGDGWDDLLVVASGEVDLLDSQDSVPWAARTVATTAGPTQVDAADVNGDGKVDAVLAGDGTVGYRTWAGSVFGAPATVANVQTLDLDASDLDGDGASELVITTTAGEVAAIRWNRVWSTLATGATSAAVGDLDGDGDPDVAVTGPSGTSVVWNDGAANFSAPELVSSAAGDRIWAVDGDGRPGTDLVVTDAVDGGAWLYGQGTPIRQDLDGDTLCDAVDDDDDGDGVAAATDCDDRDPERSPGAADPVGDGIDQDCDGADGGSGTPDTGDTGTAPIDTGTHPIDTGTPPIDTGDTGAATDTSPTDGGSIGDTTSGDEPGGCSCASPGAQPPPGLLLGAALLLARRRRSSTSTR